VRTVAVGAVSVPTVSTERVGAMTSIVPILRIWVILSYTLRRLGVPSSASYLTKVVECEFSATWPKGWADAGKVCRYLPTVERLQLRLRQPTMIYLTASRLAVHWLRKRIVKIRHPIQLRRRNAYSYHGTVFIASLPLKASLTSIRRRHIYVILSQRQLAPHQSPCT